MFLNEKVNSFLIVAAVSVLLLAGGPAMAKSFNEVGTCGKLVITGESCSKVKATFDFSGCKGKFSSTKPAKQSCVGHEIRFKHSFGNFRYQAVATRKVDDWNGVTWTTTPLTEYQRKAVPKKAKVSAVAPTVPASTPVAAPRTPASDEPALDISGFAEFKYKNVSQDNANNNADSGYMIDDAALYFSYEKDKLAINVDVPFGRGSNQDNTNFALAEGKAQAYATYNANDWFNLTFGQFDTIYGFELNDAKDRFFSEAGIVFNGALPVVHTGVMGEFSVSDVSIKLLSANPNNKGTLGTDASEDNPEHGITVGWSNNMFRVGLGYLARAGKKAVGGDSDNRTLTEVLLGGTFGPVDLDIEYDIVHDPTKDNDATEDEEADGTGLMAHLVYNLNDKVSLGLRYETISEFLTSNYSETQMSLGVGYACSDNMLARLEYHDLSQDDTENNPTTTDTTTIVGSVVLNY